MTCKDSRPFQLQKSLIYVSRHTYESCLEAIRANSPAAKVFCLIHKMDLVQEEMRDEVYSERSNYLVQRSQGLKINCIATSIWDETLYKAWSSIVYTLIPNIPVLEKHLQVFAENADAEEVVLFERTTFLVISHATRSQNAHPDLQRFEKISNIVKQFKLSCSKMQSQLTSFEMRGANFSAFICQYTSDTYILVVMGDSETGKQHVQQQVSLSNHVRICYHPDEHQIFCRCRKSPFLETGTVVDRALLARTRLPLLENWSSTSHARI